jgi:hypothetical protein
VVSNIHAGGKVTSTSSGATTMEGTKIQGDGGVEVGAQSLDYKAAHDTSSSSSSDQTINASANLGVGVGSKTVEGGASGGFDKSSQSAASSTAVTGGIRSGAGLVIKTQGDAHFEGTDIAAKGDATVDAGGKLTMDAAHDTSSSTSSSSSFEAGLQVSGGGGEGGKGGESGAGLTLGGGFQNDTSTSNQAVTGSVKSGGNLTLSAGGKASFEGTQMKSGGTATVAGSSVDFKDAKSTSSSTSSGFAAGIEVSGKSEDGKSSGAGSASVEGGYSSSSSATATKATLEAGNGVQVKTN